MRKLVAAMFHDRSGATAIEYGLIAAFIAVALVAALPALRENVLGLFSTVSDQVRVGQKYAKQG